MDFLRAQFTKIPKLKPVNLSKSTVLITGANAGLGLEAAHEILLSKPERLILAVRDIEKGDVAKRELQNRTTSSTQIDVHKLDHSSFRSVQNFVKELEGQRVDIAILNAGMKVLFLHLTLRANSFYRNVEYTLHNNYRRV